MATAIILTSHSPSGSDPKNYRPLPFRRSVGLDGGWFGDVRDVDLTHTATGFVPWT